MARLRSDDNMPNQSQIAVASAPPSSDTLTEYDRAHLVTYLKLLDAASMKVDWKIVARNVLSLDPETDLDAALRVYAAHLARARWMTRVGFRHLLK
jgi:hypothetical protein